MVKIGSFTQRMDWQVASCHHMKDGRLCLTNITETHAIEVETTAAFWRLEIRFLSGPESLLSRNRMGELVSRGGFIKRIPEAVLATAVPDPMATPISAFFRAGASLTPSPVMAATWPSSWRYSTIRLLCEGSTRENNLDKNAADEMFIVCQGWQIPY